MALKAIGATVLATLAFGAGYKTLGHHPSRPPARSVARDAQPRLLRSRRSASVGGGVAAGGDVLGGPALQRGRGGSMLAVGLRTGRGSSVSAGASAHDASGAATNAGIGRSGGVIRTRPRTHPRPAPQAALQDTVRACLWPLRRQQPRTCRRGNEQAPSEDMATRRPQATTRQCRRSWPGLRPLARARALNRAHDQIATSGQSTPGSRGALRLSRHEHGGLVDAPDRRSATEGRAAADDRIRLPAATQRASAMAMKRNSATRRSSRRRASRRPRARSSSVAFPAEQAPPGVAATRSRGTSSRRLGAAAAAGCRAAPRRPERKRATRVPDALVVRFEGSVGGRGPRPSVFPRPESS